MGTKITTITLVGGFHNAGEIKIKVATQYADRILTPNAISYYVSKRVNKRLDKHFCGIEGCKCGGVYRAEIVEKV